MGRNSINYGRSLIPERTITTAETNRLGEVVVFRPSIIAINLHCNFTYGSGGTTAKVYVQTSLDAGVTWVDIACFAHATASLRRVIGLNVGTARALATATDGALSDNTLLDGILGDRVRARHTTVGTYGGSTTLRLDVVLTQGVGR